ncbi:MAG: hypothetical protein WKF31_01650 [Thermoleophilaceae bacterium]
MVYLDASAVMKLVVEEPESSGADESSWRLERSTRVERAPTLRRYLERVRRRWWSHGCRGLTRLRSWPEAKPRVGADVPDRRQPLDADALAGTLEGPLLRALDAIHVATADLLPGVSCTAFVSYDDRQLEAADRAALPVASPGR